MTSKKYSKQEKENIILECIQSKKDYKTICSKYKIRYALLYQWVRNYEKNEKLKPMKRAQSNEERLEILLKLKEIEAKYLTAEALKHKYSIKYLCSVLNYYYFLNQTEREEEIEIKENLLEIFKSSTETYGRRRTAALNQKMHTNYNVKKIRRLMIEFDLQCVIRRKRKDYPKVQKDDIAENLLNRNFKTTMENEIWSSDITEIPTMEGKLYLSAILDVHSRSMIAYE